MQLLSHPQLLFEQEHPPFPIPGHPPLHCDEQGLPHSVADKSLMKSLHFFLTLYPMSEIRKSFQKKKIFFNF